jgi:type III secretory pathway component EscT
MDGTGLIEAVVAELERGGIDLRALGIAWARAAPVVAIVPAFGLRGLPAPVRALMGLVLAACIAPAVRAETTGDAWGWSLLVAVAHGLPIAIAAAVPLWAATMAGGAIDAVRSAGDTVSMPTVEGKPTLFGVPMALLASTIFLSTGGPARVAAALAAPALAPDVALLRATFDIAAGIQIAISVAAPVLAASVVVEVSTALIARAASPAQIQSLLAPLRSFAILAIAAFTLDRMVRVIALWVQAKP